MSSYGLQTRTVAKPDDALSLHMRIEVKMLYPLGAADLGQKPAKEAKKEHVLARDGLCKLAKYEHEPGFGAAVAMSPPVSNIT